VVYIKDHIHHLLNEFKMSIFAYNSDQRVYISNILMLISGQNLNLSKIGH